MIHPDGMAAEEGSRCETSGWNGGGEGFRVWDIQMEWQRRRCPNVRHPGGMSYVARRKGDLLRVQGRGSHATIFREDPVYTWVKV